MIQERSRAQPELKGEVCQPPYKLYAEARCSGRVKRMGCLGQARKAADMGSRSRTRGYRVWGQRCKHSVGISASATLDGMCLLLFPALLELE